MTTQSKTSSNSSADSKRYKKYLKELTKQVKVCVKALDDHMELPSTQERGKNIAKILNQLEMVNDQARHFGLGEKL